MQYDVPAFGSYAFQSVVKANCVNKAGDGPLNISNILGPIDLLGNYFCPISTNSNLFDIDYNKYNAGVISLFKSDIQPPNDPPTKPPSETAFEYIKGYDGTFKLINTPPPILFDSVNVEMFCKVHCAVYFIGSEEYRAFNPSWIHVSASYRVLDDGPSFYISAFETPLNLVSGWLPPPKSPDFLEIEYQLMRPNLKVIVD
jgi:hypothetical protein